MKKVICDICGKDMTDQVNGIEISRERYGGETVSFVKIKCTATKYYATNRNPRNMDICIDCVKDSTIKE